MLKKILPAHVKIIPDEHYNVKIIVKSFTVKSVIKQQNSPITYTYQPSNQMTFVINGNFINNDVKLYDQFR